MATPKVLLITGANGGIGYEAVKVFLEASNPYHILLGARTAAKAKGAIDSIKKELPDVSNTVEPLVIDVTSDESITQAYEQVKSSFGRLDVLINNAGASFDVEFTQGNVSLRECFNKAYDVNVTGANVTSWTFMPLLLKSSDPRLLFSAGLSLMTWANEGKYIPTPPQPAGWPKQIDFETIGYKCSKTALNMLMFDWAFKMKEDGLKVFSVSPGFLATNLSGPRATEMVKKMGAGHPRAGGIMYKSVVEGERDDQVGKVIDKDGLLPL